MDTRQHCDHEAAALDALDLVRLERRAHDVSARLLQVDAMVVLATLASWLCVSQHGSRELGSSRQDGPRQ